MNIKQLIKTNLVAVAAVVIALATMSFKLAEKGNAPASKDDADLVWFQIEPGYDLTDEVSQEDAHYLNRGSAPSGLGTCATSGTKQCVSGFNTDQVDAMTDELIGDQAPVQKPGRRS